MKIYPSNHDLLQEKMPRILDIPLAQIDKNIKVSDINFTPSDDFRKNIDKSISPYDTFDSGDYIFFDDNNNISDIKLELKDNKYIYNPGNTTEFIPSSFSMNATVKKNIVYNGFQKYNINVTVDNLDNWPNMISIFGDAYKRGVCPSNIEINGGSTEKSSLASGSIDDTDILFIKSKDGNVYSDGTEIPITDLLKKHVNMWLAIEDTSLKIFAQNNGSSKITNRFKTLYAGEIQYNSSNNYSLLNGLGFNELSDIVKYNGNYSVIEPYVEDNPVVILHMDGYGFVVVSDAGFFNNLSDNAKIIYDVMAYVYFNTYIDTIEKTSWITNESIDFIGRPYIILNKNHAVLNLDKMVDEVESDIQSFYTLCRVNINSNYTKKVFFIEKDSNNNLYFGKFNSSGDTDPEKPNGYKSLLTTKNTIMYYDCAGIKQKESLISAQGIINDDTKKNYININPFYSSKNRLRISENKLIEIPQIGIVYNILATEIKENNESDIEIKIRSDGVDDGFIKIGEAIVEYTDLKICNDIRITGGGLPENMPDDFDMLDISNLYGRLIRRGTSLIIKLPKVYEKYDKYIRDAVNKYKNASTYIVLKYSDDKE